MKKIFLIIMICMLGLLTSNHSMAQADHSFNYQGELLDNGSPANGTYDFQVTYVDTFNTPIGQPSTHLNTSVDNGLFRLNVLIGGIPAFDGFENYGFQMGVRESAVGGNFTILSPTQSLQAVPLASNLTNGSASTGQVLTFNGFQWAPQTPSQGGGSPWSTTANGINYTNGGVTIGDNLPAVTSQLHVKSSNAQVATFDGGDQAFVTFAENGINRGYIGSFVQDGVDGSADFDLGTYSGNTGSIQLTTNNSSKLTIRNTGDIKQPFIENNGMMKAMISAACSNTASSIYRSYNGVNDDNITITDGQGSSQCTITFPFDVNNRYWQVSPIFNLGDRGAHCAPSASDNQLNCYRYTTSTGGTNSGDIMVLVY